MEQLSNLMETARQLSIFLENRPGTLAKVCEELAKQEINIYALTISDTTDHSVIRMVLSDPQKALHILGERGVLVVENNVLILQNANRPGVFGKIARTLAKAKINIEYAYLATSRESEQGMAVIRVSDTKKAIKVLAEVVDGPRRRVGVATGAGAIAASRCAGMSSASGSIPRIATGSVHSRRNRTYAPGCGGRMLARAA